MGTLLFVCPTTGREVSTGLVLNSTSFQSLPNGFSEIRCPDCDQIHSFTNLLEPRLATDGEAEEVRLA